MIAELRSIDQDTRSQETVVGKTNLVSARDEVKRTEHCMKMSSRKALQSTWRDGFREWTIRVSAKTQNNRRMPCTRSGLHDQHTRQRPAARKSGQSGKAAKRAVHIQTSCARSSHEDDGYLLTSDKQNHGSWSQQRGDGQAAISDQAQEIRNSPEWSGVASSRLHDDVQRPGSGERSVFSKGHDCRRVAQARLKHEPDVGIGYDVMQQSLYKR